MKPAKTVKLNTEYINGFLYRNNLTRKEFSTKFGYADNWLASVLRENGSYKGRISENKARLMCNVWGMDYEKLVVKEPTFTPTAESPAEEADSLEKAIYMIANSMTAVCDMQKMMADYMKDMNAKVDALYKQLK